MDKLIVKDVTFSYDDHEVLSAEDAIAKAKALVDLEGDGRYLFKNLPEETLNAH